MQGKFSVTVYVALFSHAVLTAGLETGEMWYFKMVGICGSIGMKWYTSALHVHSLNIT